MVSFFRLKATLIVLMVLACGTGHAAARTTGPADPEVASFVRLLNAHRISRGLPPLLWDNRVAAVARAHSRDMSHGHYFSHTWSDGRLSWGRLTARGVTYSQAGENIAWGQTTGRAVLESWLHSPGHRKNIENGSFTAHGVGKVGAYWTHIFIRPAKTPRGRFTELHPSRSLP